MYTRVQRWVYPAELVTHYDVRLSNEDGAPSILASSEMALRM